MDIRPTRSVVTHLLLACVLLPTAAAAQRATVTPPIQPVLPGATVDTAPSSAHTRMLQRQAADAARDAEQLRVRQNARQQADRARLQAAIASGTPVPSDIAPRVVTPLATPVGDAKARARAAELERDAAEARLRRECARRADGTRAAGC